uniref:Uncharacterized protein TCIL3000_10_910 n=1 Tax=Trypanosoma congolense (strain IL3000) TaxID=1068625 RepID=G0UVB7_TRYCI|nr:unnamed protein product [Trypanosoma congolense IL3000]
MTADYPDDGHIFVCLRVRSVPAVSELQLCCGNMRGSADDVSPRMRNACGIIRASRRVCVSTLENIVVLHDPKSLDDAACVVRDAESVVQLLADRSSRNLDKHSKRRLLTATATANYYEFDACIASMDADSMLQMPVIRNSDFIRPPQYGSQEEIYLTTAVHAVAAAVEGINSCVFAYGQTGSGKTYTLFGDAACIQRDPGVVPRTLNDLFGRLETIKRRYEDNDETDYSFRVQLSFYEIYQNEVFCLFSRKGPLRVGFARDNSGRETLVIHKLQHHLVVSSDKAMSLVEMGFRRRQTGETGMNAHSSRSHAILQVQVSQWRTNRVTKEAVELSATLNIVDLAGSERQKTAKTDGKSRDEGIQINQSLTTLSRVINEISQGSKYVNYRDSLLTMVLKDNLGGNSKTFMIATVSPVAFCYQETGATLQYARDVRKIRNRPVINKSFQTRSSLLELNAALKQENEKLRLHLEGLLKRVADGSRTLEELLTDTDTKDNVQVGTISSGGHVSKARGCAGPLKPCFPVTEAVLSTTDLGAVPLIVTAHKRYTNIEGMGASCVEGGKIGITSLVRDIVQFRLSDLLNGSRCGEGPGVKSNILDLGSAERLHGVVEFERVFHSTCERHYWMRYVPPEGSTDKIGEQEPPPKDVVCRMNGITFASGDRWELTHGDVFSVYVDGADDGSEQSLLTFHYVDVNCLSRYGQDMEDVDMSGDITSLLTPVVAKGSLEDEVSQLKRDKSKLLEMLQKQMQTINYQCQFMGMSRSRHRSLSSTSNERASSVDSNHFTPNIRMADVCYDDETSPLPNPVMPYGDPTHKHLHSTSPMRGGVPSRAFHRTSDVRPLYLSTAGREAPPDYAKRSAEFEALARRLAELEQSSSPPADVPLPHLDSSGERDNRFASINESRGVYDPHEEISGVDNSEEVKQALSGGERGGRSSCDDGRMLYVSTSSLSSCTDLQETEQDKRQQHGTAPLTEVRMSSTPGTQMSAAEESGKKSQVDIDLRHHGNMNVFLSTSDGVRERYYAAKRERELRRHIHSVESCLNDLRGEISLLESKLRISQDVNTEHELREAQLQDELAELSKELQSYSDRQATLLRETNALETFLYKTEEALKEACALNETEFERRLATVSEKNQALHTIARMWKRRTMMRMARELRTAESREKSIAGSTHNVGEQVTTAGHLSWGDVRTESTASQVRQLLGERGLSAEGVVSTAEQFEKETAADSVVVLESALTGLENENSQLLSDISTMEGELDYYKKLVLRIQGEVKALEQNGREKAKISTEEGEKLSAARDKKRKELVAAEKSRDAAVTKLRSTIQAKAHARRKSVGGKGNVLQDQRQFVKQQKPVHDELTGALASKTEELHSILSYLQEKLGEDCPGGFRNANDLYERIEELVNEANDKCTGPGIYSAFPPDFQFNEELITLIRVGLRILLDRLKVELYVLNRQSLHRFGLIAPAVQLRPEAQFRYYMHELRGAISEIARKPQRIGSKWAVTEPDILSGLIDHRLRRAE